MVVVGIKMDRVRLFSQIAAGLVLSSAIIGFRQVIDLQAPVQLDILGCPAVGELEALVKNGPLDADPETFAAVLDAARHCSTAPPGLLQEAESWRDALVRRARPRGDKKRQQLKRAIAPLPLNVDIPQLQAAISEAGVEASLLQEAKAKLAEARRVQGMRASLREQLESFRKQLESFSKENAVSSGLLEFRSSIEKLGKILGSGRDALAQHRHVQPDQDSTRRQLESTIASLPLNVDIPQLQAAISEASQACDEASLLQEAKAKLAEARRVQGVPAPLQEQLKAKARRHLELLMISLPLELDCNHLSRAIHEAESNGVEQHVIRAAQQRLAMAEARQHERQIAIRELEAQLRDHKQDPLSADIVVFH